MLQYQALSPKGDIDVDGDLSENDLELLAQSILNGSELGTFETWAGDWDYNGSHSIIDLTAISLSID